MMQRLKVVPSSVAYDIAGDYFYFPLILVHDVTTEELSFK